MEMDVKAMVSVLAENNVLLNVKNMVYVCVV